ncbi:DapH/DapD/GlmU-related protein [Parabacteroides segnis]|uniref:DapH/DapD/GlmU-related protein n=1 Tax=Parabacteroides segnis TaxID=2763058 RepID=UPI00351546C4
MNYKIKKNLKKRLAFISRIKDAINAMCFLYLNGQKKQNFGLRSEESLILMPSHISNPQNVFMHDQTRIQGFSKIITYTGKFIMKKYSGAAPGLTVITGNHIPTVGIPHFKLALLRINESEKDVIVEEDVWLGANVTLLSGVTVGRGAVVGACCVISKDVPPYAVVVGNPFRIIASKFTIEEILDHEQILYSEKERFSKEYLEDLFNTYFQNKKTIGQRLNL